MNLIPSVGEVIGKWATINEHYIPKEQFGNTYQKPNKCLYS